MKFNYSFIALTVLFLACNSSKKSSKTNSASSTPAINNPPVASAPVMLVKPANGIYAPGEDELKAVKSTFADATSEQLTRGYKIYTEGACIKCHGPKDIYSREEARWQGIIDNMSQAAALTPEEKDAVSKYVFAIKATQGK